MNLDLNFYSDILAGLSAILTAFCSQRPLTTSDPDSPQLPLSIREGGGQGKGQGLLKTRTPHGPSLPEHPPLPQSFLCPEMYAETWGGRELTAGQMEEGDWLARETCRTEQSSSEGAP